VAELIAAWFDKVAVAAEGCDAVVAGGLIPAVAGARSVAEKHGGAGTTTTATGAGAPQVVGPQWADQPYWASRVAALGIGVAHDVQAPTTESLSAALSAALTPEIRARAAAVAGTIRTDGASVAAKRLLGAVSRERQPVPAELMP